jgi:hypothetical protein
VLGHGGAVQHVARPLASRLGYGRRVAPARAAVSVALVLAAAATVTACGSSARATGFCATVERGNPAFNSVDAAHQDRALAAFDKLANSAPPAVASELHAISAFHRRLVDDPKSIVSDPSLVTAYAANRKHVDAYLHDTCGVAIPPLGTIF